jgi:hypothetical protein
MGIHPRSFVAFYLKETVSREERVCTYIIARLHGRMGLHPSSFVGFYLEGAVSREEREYTLCISLVDSVDCMDGWGGYILVAL